MAKGAWRAWDDDKRLHESCPHPRSSVSGSLPPPLPFYLAETRFGTAETCSDCLPARSGCCSCCCGCRCTRACRPVLSYHHRTAVQSGAGCFLEWQARASDGPPPAGPSASPLSVASLPRRLGTPWSRVVSISSSPYDSVWGLGALWAAEHAAKAPDKDSLEIAQLRAIARGGICIFERCPGLWPFSWPAKLLLPTRLQRASRQPPAKHQRQIAAVAFGHSAAFCLQSRRLSAPVSALWLFLFCCLWLARRRSLADNVEAGAVGRFFRFFLVRATP